MTTPLPPICSHCQWLHRPLRMDGKDRCGAFPDGIPRRILDNEADHRKPKDGDRGITFTPRSDNSRAYAALVFDKD